MIRLGHSGHFESGMEGRDPEEQAQVERRVAVYSAQVRRFRRIVSWLPRENGLRAVEEIAQEVVDFS